MAYSWPHWTKWTKIDLKIAEPVHLPVVQLVTFNAVAVAWVKIDPIELPKLPHLMELMDRELPVPHLPIRPLPNRPLALASNRARKIGRLILRPNYFKKEELFQKSKRSIWRNNEWSNWMMIDKKTNVWMINFVKKKIFLKLWYSLLIKREHYFLHDYYLQLN